MCFAAASRACGAFIGSTPHDFAVAGMICAIPCAPADEPEYGLNDDSALICRSKIRGSIP
jgi:hypothetical protein